MSWKRILKSVRRMNMPVIVTDDEAKKPLIILTLEKYEQLMNKFEQFEDFEMPDDSGNSESVESLYRTADPAEGIKSAFEFLDSKEEKIQELPLDSEKINYKVADNTIKTHVEQMPENTEISLEDRFYFEPL